MRKYLAFKAFNFSSFLFQKILEQIKTDFVLVSVRFGGNYAGAVHLTTVLKT